MLSTVVNGVQVDIQPAVVFDSNNNFQSFQYMFFVRQPKAIDDSFAFTDEEYSQTDTNIKTTTENLDKQYSGSGDGDGWTGFGKSMMNQDGLYIILKKKYNK